MKFYMGNVHDIRSQKPLRSTHWSLLLGILQTRMSLPILLESLWKSDEKLIKEWGIKMDW